MSVLLCGFAFLACFYFFRRGVGPGMVALMTVGYFYGITRARLPDGISHFIFDSAIAGTYLAYATKPLTPWMRFQSSKVLPWVQLLIVWPLFMVLVPLQDYIVQLVGLRAAIWFLPMILIGTTVRATDLLLLARGLAVLNIIAGLFGVAEYLFGVERFFPRNAVTELMYSAMLAEGHRIPATFSNAHSYGGMMVLTLPFLINRVNMRNVGSIERAIFFLAIGFSGLGVFLCAARSVAIALFFMVLMLVISRRISVDVFVGICLLGALLGYVVGGSERMQRFTKMDSDTITQRVYMSVNESFFYYVQRYPMGLGLARGWGTSIPFFLEGRALPQDGLEAEYCRIFLELGPIGLLSWVAFLFWAFSRRPKRVSPEWEVFTYLVWTASVFNWLSTMIGTGALTAIPASALSLFVLGILVRAGDPPWAMQRARPGARRPMGSRPAAGPVGMGPLPPEGRLPGDRPPFSPRLRPN